MDMILIFGLRIHLHPKAWHSVYRLMVLLYMYSNLLLNYKEASNYLRFYPGRHGHLYGHAVQRCPNNALPNSMCPKSALDGVLYASSMQS